MRQGSQADMSKHVHWNPRAFGEDARRQCERILERTAQEMLSHMIELMRESKSGRAPGANQTTYGMTGKQRKGKARIQGFGSRRSAPGEAPAIQTSGLKDSLGVDSPSPLHRRIGSILGKSARTRGSGPGNPNEYAVHLEFGAPRGNLKARPFIRPTFKWGLPRFRDRMKRGRV